VVCGAKRIRSLYLPSPTERLPGISTRTPPKGPASVSTINAATMRLCRADHPASRHPNKAYRSEKRTAISAVAAGGSCIMQARHIQPRIIIAARAASGL